MERERLAQGSSGDHHVCARHDRPEPGTDWSGRVVCQKPNPGAAVAPSPVSLHFGHGDRGEGFERVDTNRRSGRCAFVATDPDETELRVGGLGRDTIARRNQRAVLAGGFREPLP